MPSLASEESPSNQNAGKTPKAIQEATANLPRETTSSEKTAVNALLMAAMAMTEMSGQNSKESTPPTGTNKSDGTQEENLVTPQKNLMGLFRSPKRKQSESEANPQDTTSSFPASSTMRDNGSQESSPSGASDEESPKREHPGDETPSNQQKIKRSRIGSMKKPATKDLGKAAMNEDTPNRRLFGQKDTIDNDNMVMETPKTKGEGPKQDLTPVSARCIDFRKMNVNEPAIQPKHSETALDSTS